jgi:hypothetical protein
MRLRLFGELGVFNQDLQGHFFGVSSLSLSLGRCLGEVLISAFVCMSLCGSGCGDVGAYYVERLIMVVDVFFWSTLM